MPACRIFAIVMMGHCAGSVVRFSHARAWHSAIAVAKDGNVHNGDELSVVYFTYILLFPYPFDFYTNSFSELFRILDSPYFNFVYQFVAGQDVNGANSEHPIEPGQAHGYRFDSVQFNLVDSDV